MNAVFTSSETLLPGDRARIEACFEGRIWDRYGLGERVVVAQQCERGSHHLATELGIAQVALGEEPADPGEVGEVIATTLVNHSMPLIRYATGDLAARSENPCSCGRGPPVLCAIEGRRDDALILPDGEVMPRAGLDQVYEYIPRIRRCQLRQERLDEILVRVEPEPGYSSCDSEALLAQLRRRLGERVRLRLDVVDEIPLTREGKFRFIVSELSGPDGGR